MLQMLFKTILFVLLFAAILWPSPAIAQNHQTRRWRVIVLVPERQLNQPQVSTPAVETEISRQLIDAGYKVMDKSRVKQLRYAAVVDRILAGGPNARTEAMRLGRMFGADILVSGKAFSQLVLRHLVRTELGTVDEYQCRARVDIRAIRVDTGELIYSDSLSKTGAPDQAEEIASTTSLQQAAEDIAPALLDKIDKISLGSTQSLELDIRGVASQSRATELEDALAKIPGVLDVSPGDYESHTIGIEVTLKASSVSRFAHTLETAASLLRFHLQVQSSNGSKIVLNAK